MGTTTATDEYEGAEYGTNPDDAHLAAAPIPVTILDTVTVQPYAPRTITTDQVPVGLLPVKVVNKVRTRATLTLAAKGADVFLGGPQVTPGSGFLLADGAAPFTMDCTDALYAVSAAGGGVVYVLSQHRDG